MHNKLKALVVIGSIAIGACAPVARVVGAQPAATPAGTCAPAQRGWDPRAAGKGRKGITIAFEQEPDVPVGFFSGMSFAGWVWQMYGIGPGKWDGNNALIPYAAQDIPSRDNGAVSADGLTVTWKLKPCLFWSDGQPITSRDFAFTWKAIMDPSNTQVGRSGFDQIAAIDTPDDRTAVIHFKSLYPAWPTLFDLGPNNSGGGLLPEHIFAGRTGLENDPQIHQPTWAGGPFAIKEWVAGDHMTLVRNPNYFGTPAKLDYIDIKIVPDPEAGLAALKTGDADFMVNLAESDIEVVEALAPQGIHLRVDQTPGFEHLFFNLGITNSTVKDASGNIIGNSDVAGFCPFQDVNVRKAIMFGIDRLSFIQNYMHEDRSAFIASMWPNSYWNNTSLAPYPYDPTQAASLLDAAGYRKGTDGIRAGVCHGKPVRFSLRLETTTAQRRIDDMATIQADLKKIGIDVKPDPIPAGVFFGSYAEGADMPKGNFDMAIYATGYFPDPDPTGSLDCADVPNKNNQSGSNLYHLCDPRIDAFVKDALATADPAARKRVYDALQQYMLDNVLIVPLYGRAAVYAYADRFILPPSSGYGGAFWDAEDFDVKP